MMTDSRAAVAPRMPSPGCDLSRHTVLITGASSGIGRATALALAARGADLVLLARREDSLERLRDDIQTQHATRAATVIADLTDTHTTRRLIAALPRVDALVNNAGMNIPQFLADIDEPHFDRIFELNVKAMFFVAQACIAKFREQGGGGAIVNVSSQMGHVGAAKRAVYCGSKHAVEGFTKAMAVELAPEAIRVNSVCPTFIATPMTAPMLQDEEFRRDVIAKIPLGRVGTPEEVANAIAFLLSPAASLMTGASLVIDGGWTAQ
jgi:NAD(P)-dependent dehydrogenase (short-subunit alcohol dehydrogenase family)